MSNLLRTPALAAASAVLVGLLINLIGSVTTPFLSMILGFAYGFYISGQGFKPLMGQLVAYLGGLALSMVFLTSAPAIALAFTVLLSFSGYAILRSYAREL